MDAAKRAVEQIAFKISEVNPLEGIVVQVGGDRVMLDIGRDHGVRDGQRYVVIREGAPIYHPVTGALIAVETTEVASFTINSVSATTSTGHKIRLNDRNSGIRVGDIVRRSR
jgi:hypothetical protein